jgi:hypothetical protein
LIYAAGPIRDGVANEHHAQRVGAPGRSEFSRAHAEAIDVDVIEESKEMLIGLHNISARRVRNHENWIAQPQAKTQDNFDEPGQYRCAKKRPE